MTTKHSGFDANTNWYEMWMKQSKDFYSSADSNLKDMFSKGAFEKPEDHLKQINKWIETLKSQWEFSQLTSEQKMYQTYVKMMGKMCSDASDMMVEQWIKRSHEENPVKSIRELYELWLNCCHEVYQKSLQSKAYQDVYGELMNGAFKFWKETMPK